jgi:hypothetical protein
MSAPITRLSTSAGMTTNNMLDKMVTGMAPTQNQRASCQLTSCQLNHTRVTIAILWVTAKIGTASLGPKIQIIVGRTIRPPPNPATPATVNPKTTVTTSAVIWVMCRKLVSNLFDPSWARGPLEMHNRAGIPTASLTQRRAAQRHER